MRKSITPRPAKWQPVAIPLTTPWTDAVDPENVLPEYPRPQMVRSRWINLNGLWEYAIRPRAATAPDRYDGHILVPFPVESSLSGVARSVSPAEQLWYRREFKLRPRRGRRVLLHFGAVDWHTRVFVNGKPVGEHKGGFDPFTFDVTTHLRSADPQQLVVCVTDPTDSGAQPRGKQKLQPEGIWYTAVTGIWQTVWLELVPPISIASLRVTPDIDAAVVRLSATVHGRADHLAVRATVLDRGRPLATASGPADEAIELPLRNAKLWSPRSPHLYDLEVDLLRRREKLDRVQSYFGMRKISIGRSGGRFTRILLNDEPLFHFGPLDQGWWPDGLYTPPSDQAIRFDLETMKKLGFNTIRKHVKVEPARWYYWADRLGLLVWQDMPSGGISGRRDHHIGPRDSDAALAPSDRAQIRAELKSMLKALHNHPSIVVWVPFNEGWAQFDTNDVLAWVKRSDPTRLVDGPSGWADRGFGDLKDLHKYPGPGMLPPEEGRASVLGEFGGLGLPVRGHLWSKNDNWGYRTYESRSKLEVEYRKLIKALPPLIKRGLAAAIYTQTTDVEGEVNGLITYDRRLMKMSRRKLATWHRQILLHRNRRASAVRKDR